MANSPPRLQCSSLRVSPRSKHATNTTLWARRFRVTISLPRLTAARPMVSTLSPMTCSTRPSGLRRSLALSSSRSMRVMYWAAAVSRRSFNSKTQSQWLPTATGAQKRRSSLSMRYSKSSGMRTSPARRSMSSSTPALPATRVTKIAKSATPRPPSTQRQT